MSARNDSDYLVDILEAINRVLSYVAEIDYKSFLDDMKSQDAIIRNLEIMGEAAKSVSAEMKTHAPDIPWKSLAGVRDKLIHQYFGINLEIVWSIATYDLPELKQKIEKLLL